LERLEHVDWIDIDQVQDTFGQFGARLDFLEDRVQSAGFLGDEHGVKAVVATELWDGGERWSEDANFRSAFGDQSTGFGDNTFGKLLDLFLDFAAKDDSG
jgi:hypothetical protein